MDPNSEKRDSPRFEHNSTVMVENYPSGQCHEGRMLNYSRSGMYFETDVAPQIGADIFIGIENSPYSADYDIYRARVVWCKKLPEKTAHDQYCVGVKYY